MAPIPIMVAMESVRSRFCFLPCDLDQVGRQLDAWQRDWPAMGVVALLPEALQAGVPMLQQACRERRLPLAGAIFPAVVDGAVFRTDGLWLMRLDAAVPTVLLGDLPQDAQAAAVRIAGAVEALLPTEPPDDVRPNLFLLFDGMLPHIASILDHLYLRLADRVEYAGANAGSETFQPMPCLFDQDALMGQGVLALLLPGPSAIVLSHGYPVPEHAMTATATAGNQIVTIDWRPAFDVYQELMQAEFGIALTRENFYQHAVHFPFGLVHANQEVAVRIPVGLSDDGALHCVGEVPENAMLVLLRAPDAQAAECVGTLVEALARPHGLRAQGDLLTFYCAGRRMHLGESAARELARLALDSRAGRMAGALSLGEIGSTRAWGYPTFHNASLVCMPWHSA